MSEMPLHDLIHAAGFAGPAAFGIEDGVINAVLWLKLGVEAIGALVIGIGVIAATGQFIRTLFSPHGKDYNQIRLTLARHILSNKARTGDMAYVVAALIDSIESAPADASPRPHPH